jgi:5'-3' exonuclease
MLLQEQQQQQQQQEPSKEALQDYVAVCTHYVMKRLQIVQQTTGAQLLVVLDGRSPPIKAQEVAKRRRLSSEHNRVRQDPTIATGSPGAVQAANARRTTANKRAGPGRHVALILESLVEALRATSKQAAGPSDVLSFMVAPYEADAQLAYLANQHYIDLIITEDSDLIAHGAPYILYKSLRHIADGTPAGVLWQKQDVGAMALGARPSGEQKGPSVNVTSGNAIQMMDFTPVMIAVMFVLMGCDYTAKKLKGIGLVSAHRIVRQAFLSDGRRGTKRMNTEEKRPSVLSTVLNEAYRHSYEQSTLTPEFKREYERSFMEALFMYRHPVVFDPVLRECIIVNRRFQDYCRGTNGGDGIDNYKNLGDPELLQHEEYAKLCQDRLRIAGIVGEIPPIDDAVGIVEGAINWRTRKPTPLSVLAIALGVSLSETQTNQNMASEQQHQREEPGKRKLAAPSHNGEQATETGEETAESGRKRIRPGSRKPGLDKRDKGLLPDSTRMPQRTKRAKNLWSDSDNEELEKRVAAVWFDDPDDEDSHVPRGYDQPNSADTVGTNQSSRNTGADEIGNGEEGSSTKFDDPYSEGDKRCDGKSRGRGNGDKQWSESEISDRATSMSGNSEKAVQQSHRGGKSPDLKTARKLFEVASLNGKSAATDPQCDQNAGEIAPQQNVENTEYPLTQEWHADSPSSEKKRTGRREKNILGVRVNGQEDVGVSAVAVNQSNLLRGRELAARADHEKWPSSSGSSNDNRYDSDATVPMSPDNEHRNSGDSAITGSKTTTQHSPHTRGTPESNRAESPNLLASSNSEKTKPSQSQETCASTSKTSSSEKPRSPDLLASSTPEQSQSVSKRSTQTDTTSTPTANKGSGNSGMPDSVNSQGSKRTS